MLSTGQEEGLREGHDPLVAIQDVKETLLVITGGEITIKTLRVFHGTGTSYRSDYTYATTEHDLSSEGVGALHYVTPSTLGQATKFTCVNGSQRVLVLFCNDVNRLVGCFKGAQIGSDSWAASGSFRFV